MDDVHRAVREITEQAHLLAVKDSAPQERLLLVAITNEVHLGGKVRAAASRFGGRALFYFFLRDAVRLDG